MLNVKNPVIRQSVNSHECCLKYSQSQEEQKLRNPSSNIKAMIAIVAVKLPYEKQVRRFQDLIETIQFTYKCNHLQSNLLMWSPLLKGHPFSCPVIENFV
jgi:hypothetical protein